MELVKDHSSDKNIFVRIPNLEIKECFSNNIKSRFGNSLKKDNLADKIASALLTGDSEFVQTQLRIYLKKFVSIRDCATKAPHENYYHGFLNGLFSNCSKEFFSEYHSNAESGDGYADILFTDSDCEKGVVIELKAAKSGNDLVTLSEEALGQIENKSYASSLMKNRMIKSIYVYGIAFFRKNCYISYRKVK